MINATINTKQIISSLPLNQLHLPQITVRQPIEDGRGLISPNDPRFTRIYNNRASAAELALLQKQGKVKYIEEGNTFKFWVLDWRNLDEVRETLHSHI